MPTADASRVLPPSIDREEKLKFAREFVENINKGELEKANRMFDYDKFLDVATEGIEIPEKSRKPIRESFNKQIESSSGILGPLLNLELKVLVRSSETPQDGILIRSLDPVTFGLGYLELHIHRNGSGELRVFDAYIYAGGESFADRYRRLLLPFLAQFNNNPSESLLSKSHLDSMRGVQVMLHAWETRDFQKVVLIYKELPENIQNLKPVILLYLNATIQSKGSDYVTALEKFAILYPNDPALYLQQVDYFYAQKNHKRVLEGYNALEQSIATSDPYLDVLKSTAYYDLKDFTKAEESARKALCNEPDLAFAADALVNTSLATRNFTLTSEALGYLLELEEVTVPLIEANPNLAPWRASKEGQAWLKAHKDPTPPKTSDAEPKQPPARPTP